jgi:hypothetical protein
MSLHSRLPGALLAAAFLALSLAARTDQAPVASRPRPPGKTVFLSPGHGLYHDDSLGWIT